MFTVELYRHGNLEIPDDPLCTLEVIEQARNLVLKNQGPLFDQLPDGHIWKEGKLAHIGIVNEAKQPILTALKNSMCPENFGLLELIYQVHDLGRVPEALKKAGKLPQNYHTFANHAEESINLLSEWGVLFGALPAAASDVIRYAIRHHIDEWTPEVPETPEPGDVLRIFITALLRDMDKYAIFIQKTSAYLHDSEKKRQEIELHGFAGEQYQINPRGFLDAFSARNVPSKKLIVSYEAYMVYYLSWIFDVNLGLVLARIVDTGALRQLLGYFRTHLPEAEYRVIYDTTHAYLSERGLKS